MIKTELQVALFKVGGQAAAGRLINVSRKEVNRWVQRGFFPVERCMPLEDASSGVLARRLLRPGDWSVHWPDLRNDAVMTSAHPSGQDISGSVKLLIHAEKYGTASTKEGAC